MAPTAGRRHGSQPAGLTAGDLDRIARGLKPDDWLMLSLTPIKSVPVFEYRAREAEYIPFRNASGRSAGRHP